MRATNEQGDSHHYYKMSNSRNPLCCSLNFNCLNNYTVFNGILLFPNFQNKISSLHAPNLYLHSSFLQLYTTLLSKFFDNQINPSHQQETAQHQGSIPQLFQIGSFKKQPVPSIIYLLAIPSRPTQNRDFQSLLPTTPRPIQTNSDNRRY
jgi:hypothetical protein